MRIAVVGVGGGFGVALAKAGADVTFIARGAHLAAMKSQGLKVQGGRGVPTPTHCLIYAMLKPCIMGRPN